MPPSIGADLTPDQAEALEFIRATVRERGFPPTIKEIAKARGTTQAAAIELVDALERKRRLRRVPYVVRSLIVLEGPASGEGEDTKGDVK
jgi:repressor LexA